MWETLLKFIGPILQQALGAGAGTAAQMGVQSLFGGGEQRPQQPQRPGMAPAQGAGMVPGAPPGVTGAGSTSNPSGSLNFGGGYTGGPDPRQMGQPGQPAQPGQPSTGFTTMGFPGTDQMKMRKVLQGNESGFQSI